MTEVAFDGFVRGVPAPFATAGERPWKNAMQTHLAAVLPLSEAAFVELAFAIAPATGYAVGADLDNFCEPVFSVLANRLGWFGASRPNILAFRARKRLAEPTGCRIRISAERWQGSWVEGVDLLDEGWHGHLPGSARDASFARWVAAAMSGPAPTWAALGVDLRFSGRVNLGDIATGPLKHVIDCLYPLLGGVAGAPNDARVSVLEAATLDGQVSGAVHVRVVELPV